MKTSTSVLGLLVVSMIVSHCKSGLVTMSNSCYDLINSGKTLSAAANYQAALDNFNKVLQKCDAYDAKEKGYAGKAAALNGLQQYRDALDAANAGLKINTSSLDNLFEKANAELALGMADQAKTDLNTITALTEKNRNIPQRATLYAKIAETEMKQQLYTEALQHIGQAIFMDNSNLNFYVQRGDINVAAGNLSTAIGNYDEAIAKGSSNAVTWKARTTTLIKLYQKKYGTDNADLLGKKIERSDRLALCNSIRASQEAGMKDISIDLVQASICK